MTDTAPPAPTGAPHRHALLSLHTVMVTLAFASVAYHLWLVTAGLIPHLVSRPLHIVAVLPFVFLFTARPATGWRRVVDVLLCAFGLAGCAYVLVQHEMLDNQYGRLRGPLQFVVACGLILLALEMARRQVKWAMPATAGLALLYGLFGQYLPGELGHAGIPLASFLGTLTITEGGLWGELTGTSAEVVAVFVILGAVIGAGEGGQGFMAASSGGQIMPPVMGAGAFIMVELLRTTYNEMLMAALPPAVLFFWGGCGPAATCTAAATASNRCGPRTSRPSPASPGWCCSS